MIMMAGVKGRGNMRYSKGPPLVIDRLVLRVSCGSTGNRQREEDFTGESLTQIRTLNHTTMALHGFSDLALSPMPSSSSSSFYQAPEYDTLQLHGQTPTPQPTLAHSACGADLFALKDFGNIYSKKDWESYCGCLLKTRGSTGRRGSCCSNGVRVVGSAVSADDACRGRRQYRRIRSLVRRGVSVVLPSFIDNSILGQSFKVTFRKFGITARFIDSDDPSALRGVFASYRTFLRLRHRRRSHHAHHIPLVVDNTFGMCGPLDLGADIVTASATKWIGGHGTTIGGVVVDGGKFDYVASNKFPAFTVSWVSYLGLPSHPSHRQALATLRPGVFGGVLNFGVKLFPVFTAASGNASKPGKVVDLLRLASNLANLVTSFARACRHDAICLATGTGSVRHMYLIVSDPDSYLAHSSSLGDAKTLVIHPASPTHQQLSEEELKASGVRADLIRVSVGIDIIADFDYVLRIAFEAPTPP
ncbi:O-acetylhomoserine ami [Mycena amicta]|nr:O-acetylhomoserine ami [Mycena amicta]